jgi:hypothetical protein
MDMRYWDKQAKKEVVLKEFQKTIDIRETFVAELIWTTNKIRLAVSKTESHELAIPQPINKSYISASTGDLRCESVVLGKATL